MDNEHHEYERLIKPIEDQMIRSVWRITRNPDDADESMQEALLIIWQKFDKIRSHPNPQALILRICVNSAYDVLRKKSRHRNREQVNVSPLNSPCQQPVGDELITNEEKRAEIFQAIMKLSKNQAAAVLMRFIHELSYSDIAQALGCGEATVRKHIERARIKLSKLLAHLLPNPAKEVEQ